MTASTPRSRERLHLAALALLAPLPLPLNGVIGWTSLAAFWLAVGLVALRAARGAESWLPAWAMNLLALAYLPFLYFDLSTFWRGQPLQPLVHLAMFALAVKLFALRRERDKWQALSAIFFIFLAAMGSSVHPAVILFLITFLALAVLALARFAGDHAQGGVPAAGRRARPVPLAGFVALATVLVMAGSIPLFVMLPRLRQPYVMGPAGGAGAGEAAGFWSSLGLNTIGRARSSRAVALRFVYEGTPPPETEMRFKAATYDLFTGDGWRRGGRESVTLRRELDGFFHLGEARARGWAEVWQKRAGTGSLVLPVEAARLDLPARALALDRGGVVSLLGPAPETVSYRVGLAAAPVLAALEPPALPQERGRPAAARDPSGITPRIAALAGEVAGEGSAAERAARLERYLLAGFEYDLELGTEAAERPIERFLFDTRRGHCEYFASALVLLLRAQDIPARLVTGYLGADYNPLERYYIVRQSHAHAWVEADLEGGGWSVLDPTPAAGRPLSRAAGLGLLLEQAYDALIFRWDRYVLTYGFNDQLGFAIGLRNFWKDLLARFGGGERERPETPAAPPADSAEPQGEVDAPPTAVESLRWLPLLAPAAALLWWLRHRRGFDATRAYRALRARLDAVAPVADSTPPLEVARRLGRRFPAAAAPASRVVSLYLRESFAGERLDAAERERLEAAFRQARRGLARRLRRAS